jgi:tRNA(fMet)-specific endonuclease VapC
MRFLFDTDVLSNLCRNTPSPSLRRRLVETPADEQATSSITLGELLFGAHRLGSAGVRYQSQIEALVRNLAVLPFDERSARTYAELRADLERQGAGIGDGDTRIASVALTHGLVMVTGNTRHFERVPGLQVENWLAE